jgi:hypothetical protein
MMRTCATCRWWNPTAYADAMRYDILNFEEGITKYNPPRGAGICEQPNEEMFTVELLEYGNAVIRTAPAFSCCLWEQKP